MDGGLEALHVPHGAPLVAHGLLRTGQRHLQRERGVLGRGEHRLLLAQPGEERLDGRDAVALGDNLLLRVVIPAVQELLQVLEPEALQVLLEERLRPLRQVVPNVLPVALRPALALEVLEKPASPSAAGPAAWVWARAM